MNDASGRCFHSAGGGPPALPVEKRGMSGGPAANAAVAKNAQQSLFVINADGTGLMEIIDFGTTITGLDWSPNGKQIAVALGLTTSDIYKLNADGTGLTRLTFNETSADPSWTR